jgi:queuine/archaeosine tRNA-ribosyltransferase
MSSSNVIFESKPFSRVTEVSISEKKLVTPTYFPAVSSYGIRYRFHALVRLITAYSYPRLLISAYDFHLLDDEKKKELSREISEYWKKGGFVFLDSGIYESFWKADAKWTFNLYETSVSQIDFDFYCSFDVLPDAKTQTMQFARDTFDSILACSNLSNKPGFVPILHGVSPNKLVSLITSFVKKFPHLCDFIAVPERDCGYDIVQKARTMVKIRKILDNNDKRGGILHVLGCGNPISLVLFSYCGVNMFDSLDWIKHVIDKNRLTINDFSQLELINCECAICSGRKRSYTEKVLLHNLLFYQNYMLQIQSLIRRNEIFEFLCEHLGKDLMKKIGACMH